MIKKALRDLLVSDSSITDDLAEYEFTSGVLTPAIFTGRKIPDNANYPVIFITLDGGPSDFSTRTQQGADVGVSLTVFDDKDQSDVELFTLAEKVWKKIHQKSIADLLPTYEDWGMRADFPSNISDKDTFPGYVIRANLRLLLIGD